MKGAEIKWTRHSITWNYRINSRCLSCNMRHSWRVENFVPIAKSKAPGWEANAMTLSNNIQFHGRSFNSCLPFSLFVILLASEKTSPGQKKKLKIYSIIVMIGVYDSNIIHFIRMFYSPLEAMLGWLAGFGACWDVFISCSTLWFELSLEETLRIPISGACVRCQVEFQFQSIKLHLSYIQKWLIRILR